MPSASARCRLSPRRSLRRAACICIQPCARLPHGAAVPRARKARIRRSILGDDPPRPPRTAAAHSNVIVDGRKLRTTIGSDDTGSEMSRAKDLRASFIPQRALYGWKGWMGRSRPPTILSATQQLSAPSIRAGERDAARVERIGHAAECAGSLFSANGVKPAMFLFFELFFFRGPSPSTQRFSRRAAGRERSNGRRLPRDNDGFTDHYERQPRQTRVLTRPGS